VSIFVPTFAALQTGWYRRTKKVQYARERIQLDAFWNAICDEVLANYVRKYGVLYSAFALEIRNDVAQAMNVNLSGIKYYDYYFGNRIMEIPELKRLVEDSYSNLKDAKYSCKLCSSTTLLLEAHPAAIKANLPPRFCTDCYFLTRPYHAQWDMELRSRFLDFFANLDKGRKCDICKHKYRLNRIGIAVQNIYLPIVHANLYASICPECLCTCQVGDRELDASEQLQRLFNLYLYTNRIPPQDYGSLLYLYNSKEQIVSLVQQFQVLWPAEYFRMHFGSYFAALIKSGILPKGTRRMRLGTMVLADDGHVCFSLVEKDIDDLLFRNGIWHHKEVPYPESDYRADWQIEIKGSIYFLEYFGLMSNPDYARKAKSKLDVAAKHNIRLIALYPDTNWYKKLADFIKNLGGTIDTG